LYRLQRTIGLMPRFLHAPHGGSSHAPSGGRAQIGETPSEVTSTTAVTTIRTGIAMTASLVRVGSETNRPRTRSASRTAPPSSRAAQSNSRARSASAPTSAGRPTSGQTGPGLPPAPGARSPPRRRQSGQAMGVDNVAPGARRRGPPPAAHGLQAFLPEHPWTFLVRTSVLTVSTALVALRG